MISYCRIVFYLRIMNCFEFCLLRERVTCFPWISYLTGAVMNKVLGLLPKLSYYCLSTPDMRRSNEIFFSSRTTFLGLIVLINLNLITVVSATFCYTDCYRTKGCFFKPYGCVPYINCTYAFSYQSDGEWAYMELLGQTTGERNNFVAAAFSRDQQMGDDSVVECSSFNNGPLLGRASYNQGKTNIRLDLEEVC